MKFTAGLLLSLVSAAAIAGTGGPVNGIPEPGIWGLLGVAGVALAISRFFGRKK